MNPDWDEKEIEGLFRELRQAEERLTPSFASVWERALSRTDNVRPSARLFPVVAAAIILSLLSVSVAIFFRPPAQPAAPTRVAESLASSPESPPARLLSQWRPPTDFLLRSPGEPLLKTVPQLGDSLVEIKAIMADQKN